VVVVSDYMRAVPDQISRFVERRFVSLGTDGFGRSENREALRDFFEVDAKHIVLATLGALVREKKIGLDVMKKAIRELGINPEKLNPARS
jgi:pyruvate dehydrogenase E1 component